MNILGKYLVIFFMLALTTLTVRSSECVTPETICQAYNRFSLIFTGTVIKVNDYKTFKEYEVLIRSTIKGSRQKIMTIVSYKKGEVCSKGPELILQQSYLLYVHSVQNLNVVRDEKFGAKLLAESNQDLIELNKLKLMSPSKRKSCDSPSS
jgi:hypothetical protein